MTHPLHKQLRHSLLLASGLLFGAQAIAAQAGWRQIEVAGATPDASPTVVALYYPTQATARAISMGPFTATVAIQGTPDAVVKGLIVLSHGTGGSELGHTRLAEALAQNGYLVAALRHPGDNWQDRSLLTQAPERYFTERPLQASRVIDALLRNPDWKGRIATDGKGPRIGALGHSAGGYTVLALAGGEPDMPRLATHCKTHLAEDPIFCGMGRTPAGTAGAAPSTPATTAPTTTTTTTALAPSTPTPTLRDPRVRAVVVMSPVGAVFSAQSLAKIRVPTLIYEAERDRFLVPRFHAEWIASQLPGVELQRVPNAWHFAFMDTPSMPIPSEDGDIGADPPGFDRRAFLDRLTRELPAFFDKALR